MTAFRKQLFTGIAAMYIAAGSLTAHAQTPPVNEPHQHDHAAMMAHMKERMAKRQAELHDKLKLNASQEAAWNTYLSKIKPDGMSPRPDRAEMAKLSAPERMERHLAMMKEHEKHLETRIAATKQFYATLTPEQQKIFNDEFARGWEHGHGHGPRHGKHDDRMAPDTK